MRNTTKGIIYLLFFASGVSGLIYEVVWIRLFGLVLGNTTYAISVVIGSFFAGLALGGFYCGRYIDNLFKDQNNSNREKESKVTGEVQALSKGSDGSGLIRIYIYLEFGIAFSALFVGIGTSGVKSLLIWFNQHINYSSTLFDMVRFFSSFVLLLIPTFLMGATLPVLSKYLIREFKGVRSGLGTLYGVNTFGAALGCLITGFYLIETIGVNATIYTGVSINLCIGVGALILERTGFFRSVPETDLRKAIPKKMSKPATISKDLQISHAPLTGLALYAVLIAFGIAGFTSLAYEITWTRMLSSIFLNSIYSFTTMLTTFLCGLGIGSFIIARFFKRSKNQLMLFAIVEFCIGISGFLLIIVFSWLPEISSRILSFYAERHGSLNWSSNVCVEFILSFMVMIVPSIFIGMTFPLATQIITPNIRFIGRSIGNIYSINALGGIIGALITGCLLIQLIGLKSNQIYIAVLNILVGTSLFLLAFKIKKEKQPGNLLLSRRIIAAVFIFSFTIAIGFFCSRYDIRVWDRNSNLLYYNEGPAATVSVIRENDGNRSLIVNNRYRLGTSKATPLQERMGYIPLLLHDKPEDVLVIGMGTGITLSAVSSTDLTKRVDCLEIIPSVVDAAKQFFYEENRDINSEKTNIITEDGRNYILINKKKYDVIISDLFVPYHAGAGSLYSKEHFDVCKERLSDNGMFCQWLPLYQMSDKEFKIICKTFCNSFPDTTLWFCNFERGLICGLIGTKEKFELDPLKLRQKMQLPWLKHKLQKAILGSAEELLSLYITDKNGLEQFAGDSRINSDNNPIIEFLAPKNIYKTNKNSEEIALNKDNLHIGIRNLLIVADIRQDVSTILSLENNNHDGLAVSTNSPFDMKNMGYFSDATEYLITGLLNFYNNKLIQSEDEFLTAWELASDYLYLRKMYQDLAVKFYRIEKYDETIFINKRLVDDGTGLVNPYLYFYLGLAYQAKGSSYLAMEAYNNALSLRPLNSASIHYNLGLIYQSQGMVEMADLEFNKAKSSAERPKYR